MRTWRVNVAIADVEENAIELRRVSLAPDGRELMGELSWFGQAFDGTLAASLFYRSEPDHIRSAPDDRGLLVRWSRGF